MKKILSGRFVAVVMFGLLALTACGEPVANQTANVPSSSEKAAPVTEKVTAPASMQVTPAPVDNGQTSSAVDNSEVAFSPLKNLDTDKILANYKADMIKAQQAAMSPDNPSSATVNWENDIASYYRFYDAGEIKKTPYAGQRLLVLAVDCEGPCGTSNIQRFAWDEQSGKLSWLSGMSNQGWLQDNFNPLKKNEDSNFIISALDIPNAIMLPDGKNTAALGTPGIDYQKTEQDKKMDADHIPYDFVDLGKVAFTDPKWGNIYFSAAPSNSGCLYLVTPDGVISTYAYDPGLLDEKNYQTVNWADNSADSSLSSDYGALFRGCGVGNDCYFVENVKDDQLVVAGKSSRGMTLYAAKDTKQVSQDAAANATVGDPNATLNQTYNSYVDMFQYLSDDAKKAHPKMTYADFLASHPIIYWKDPFGRYSALIRNEVKPPAECGKPVIYLYPEKTQKVSVKVGIDQLTKTEPAYGQNGWDVIASPNGVLKNLADGLTYPYLFWEGISKKQVPVNGGFVVAKANLEKFLDSSLVKLGLNKQERVDFVAFWLPKMEAMNSDYLQVSFVGTSDFNKVAPLTITPKPDTLIRVFMYYQPTSATTVLPAQKLSALDRRGFTVVEWGGTSSDGWQIR